MSSRMQHQGSTINNKILNKYDSDSSADSTDIKNPTFKLNKTFGLCCSSSADIKDNFTSILVTDCENANAAFRTQQISTDDIFANEISNKHFSSIARSDSQ